MFLKFRAKKLLILGDNEIGPRTDFSRPRMASVFIDFDIQNVFGRPNSKTAAGSALEVQLCGKVTEQTRAQCFAGDAKGLPGIRIVEKKSRLKSSKK
jgi:hypothetical protein